ncbi:MAG TPA: hypothetical protein VHB21_06935, partial [Minicystis sp.]|nr:hypothetical protein [Minicystis sp.]
MRPETHAFRRLRAPLAAVLVALAPPLAGCATTGANAGPARVEGAITPVAVSDADFAASAERVLRDGKPSPERLGLLVGVVRRQLAHAAKRYAEGHDGRATDAVIGALYLVRAGEGRAEMIDAAGSKALEGALERLAPRGDEGRALALYRMRQPTLPPGTRERAQLDAHIAALEAWMRDTRTGGPMKRLGDDERAAVSRALIEPTDEALETASKAIDAWIDRAILASIEYRTSAHRPDRDEAVEVARAVDSGAVTLAALFLRHGDVKGALEHLDRSSAIKRMPPSLYSALRATAKSDGAQEWLSLAAAFARHDESDEDLEVSLDPEVQTAALWGCAVEAYRRDPKSPDAAALLSRVLLHYGMPEVAPAVLSESVAAQPSPQIKSAAMDVLVQALVDAAQSEGPDAARRVFAAAPVLLAEADKGGAEPSSARARYLMASIEVRAGNLAAAEPLMKRAVTAEPSTSGLTTLALVERQAGNVKAAIDAVGAALRAPDARGALLDVAEANLVGFELYRAANQDALAKQSLDAALSAALAGRGQRGNASTRARAERLLGRILEGYGETKGAARAFERAIAAAAADKPTLGAAMLDAIGRALIRRDLVAARAALKKGLDADVGEDDLVYGAL